MRVMQSHHFLRKLSRVTSRLVLAPCSNGRGALKGKEGQKLPGASMPESCKGGGEVLASTLHKPVEKKTHHPELM